MVWELTNSAHVANEEVADEEVANEETEDLFAIFLPTRLPYGFLKLLLVFRAKSLACELECEAISVADYTSIVGCRKDLGGKLDGFVGDFVFSYELSY